MKKEKRFTKRRRQAKKRPMAKEMSTLPTPPSFPQLSSHNIAKVLSHFMTVRSTVKDLSTSLQRMEKMMDSTYQMFEIAQQMVSNRRLPLLPPEDSNPPQKTLENKEEIPLIQWPEEGENNPPNSPIAQLFQQIDPRFIFQALKSPMVQRILSQFLARPQTTSYRTGRKRKQG